LQRKTRLEVDMDETLREKPHAAPVSPSNAASMIIDDHYAPPPEDGDGKLWVRTSVLVQSDAEGLYRLWRNVENAPAWQDQIAEVRRTGEKTSHWVMRSREKDIEWDSEILADEPGKRIAWRSIGGESDNAGEVIFENAPGGRGTVVTVLQEFRMGKLASAWQTLVARNPKPAVIENLRHFKALAETGEIPRTEPQPHGDRGTTGELKKSLYGEKIPVPQGTKKRIRA
jgi:uncharacterized membrane protein